MAKPAGIRFVLLLAFFLVAASIFLTKLPKSIPHKPTISTQVFGIKIVKNPPHSVLHDLAVSTWPKYTSEPTKIPWTFKVKETIYLLEGKVKISVEGHEGSFEIGADDLVVFPKGMNITWEVLETVTKHYNLEK